MDKSYKFDAILANFYISRWAAALQTILARSPLSCISSYNKDFIMSFTPLPFLRLLNCFLFKISIFWSWPVWQKKDNFVCLELFDLSEALPTEKTDGLWEWECSKTLLNFKTLIYFVWRVEDENPVFSWMSALARMGALPRICLHLLGQNVN